jgi:hypothetical protein
MSLIISLPLLFDQRMNELETKEPFFKNNELHLFSKEDLLREKKFKEVEIEKLEAVRAQCEPKWWSEWLALNRPSESSATKKFD